ncbi:MAG: hypothetical protein JHC95_06790 [Solirubrobacteraceae bacterium]|nr:hypothetical protein [Solirubrobacteraceae bacterium]
MDSTTVDRRTFLARAGVLGLALSAPPGLLDAARANPTGDAVEALIRWLRPQLRRVSAETHDALAAFSLPGDDRFSRRQHLWRPEPGGVAAGCGPFLMKTIDGYLPVPDRVWIPTLVTSTRVLGNVPAPLPPDLRRLGLADAQRFDRALEIVLTNDETIPASIVIALLLNVTATILTPAVLWRSGGVAPFAKLSYNEKGRVFRDFEGDTPKIVTLLRRSGALDGWLVDALDGLIKYLAMAALALSADGMWSEQSTYDPATKRLSGRPIGWDQTGYLIGRTEPPDGHADLLGYYQDRTEVEA